MGDFHRAVICKQINTKYDSEAQPKGKVHGYNKTFWCKSLSTNRRAGKDIEDLTSHWY